MTSAFDPGLPGFTPRMDNNISSMPIRFLSDPSGLFLLAKECTCPMPAFEWGVINEEVWSGSYHLRTVSFLGFGAK